MAKVELRGPSGTGPQQCGARFLDREGSLARFGLETEILAKKQSGEVEEASPGKSRRARRARQSTTDRLDAGTSRRFFR
jgi:hypothetical protein